MTPAQFARSQIGVRWHHQGRKPGNLLDCIGLTVFAYQPWGIRDVDNYGQHPANGLLERQIEKQFGPPISGPLQENDLVIMAFPKVSRHVGIVANYLFGGLSIIHTWNGGAGVVIETKLEPKWIKRIKLIHRLEGVA